MRRQRCVVVAATNAIRTIEEEIIRMRTIEYVSSLDS
jgi:hypothetical protein